MERALSSFPTIPIFLFSLCVYCLCKQILLNVFDPFPVRALDPPHPLSVDCFSVENGKHESIMPNPEFRIYAADGAE